MIKITQYIYIAIPSEFPELELIDGEDWVIVIYE